MEVKLRNTQLKRNCKLKGENMLEFPKESEASPAPQGVFRDRAPKTRNVPPKRELCPKESNRLSANGMQFEALESQITDHHPRIREQELFFSHILQRHFFLVFNLEFVKILTYFDIKTFGCWFTLSDSKVKVFLPPPPQSRYSGARPGVQMRKEGV